jgi:HEAT repeat protein
MAVVQPDLPPDPQVVDTLHQLGVTLVDELLPLLHSPDEDIAQKACWALGYAGKKTHSRALLNVLQGSRPALWMQSAVSLSLLESKQPTRGLLQLTLDATRPADQRYATAYALLFARCVQPSAL